MNRDTTNVEHELYDYSGNNWNNRNIEKGLKKSSEDMPEKLSTDSLPKTAVLGTSHRARKVLQSETGSPSGGDHRGFRRRGTGEKRLVTRHNEITRFISIQWVFIKV